MESHSETIELGESVLFLQRSSSRQKIFLVVQCQYQRIEVWGRSERLFFDFVSDCNCAGYMLDKSALAFCSWLKDFNWCLETSKVGRVEVKCRRVWETASVPM